MQVNKVAFKSWLDWFANRPSSIFINKKRQEELFQSFQNCVSNDECINLIKKNTEITYLFRQSNDSLGIFHHLTTVGGTIMDNTESTGFILGVEEDLTAFLKFDLNLLTDKASSAEKIPILSHLTQLSKIEDVENLQVGSTTSFQPRNFIPLPPFTIPTVNECIMNGGNSKTLLVECAKSFRTFDADHAGDGEYVDKAKSKCKDLLAWLYLASKDKVQVVPTLACMDRPLVTELKKLTQESLQQDTSGVPAGPPPPSSLISPGFRSEMTRSINVIAAAAVGSHDAMQKLANFQEKSNDKETKSFKKMPEPHQKMLLIASSRGNVVPTDLNDKAMKFFACSTVSKAKEYLNSYLEQKGIDCRVPTAMATALWNGSFRWEDAISPSGLVSSTISSVDIMRPETLQESVFLDWSMKHELNQATLDKVSKHHVVFPANVDEMIERIRALHALVELFLGDKSRPAKGLDEMISETNTGNTKLRMKQKTKDDKYLIAKILFCIDDLMNQFFGECRTAQSISDVTEELTKFKNIVTEIKLNKFHCQLPKQIARIKKREEEEKNPDREIDTSSSKKRKAEQDRAKETERERERQRKIKDNTVWNDNLQECIRIKPNEDWDNTFKKKSNRGPVLSNGSMPCLKFHVKGICYTDCYFKKSHIPLAGDDLKKVQEYVKQLHNP